MLAGSRHFVTAVFIVLGAAFWATTIQLYLEFAQGTNLWTLDKPIRLFASLQNYEQQPWFLLITHYSDLFVFFPVFGSIALIAFHTPAAVLVDIYWNKDRHGDYPIHYSEARFAGWFFVLVMLSLFFGWKTLGGSERTLWQLKPDVLKADRGVGCVAAGRCERVSFIDALSNVRQISRERITLSDLKRDCSRDRFIEQTGDKGARRYCPPLAKVAKLNPDDDLFWVRNKACCAALQRFDSAVKTSFAAPSNRSSTTAFQAWMWPFYVFFLLTLVAISTLLAVRRERIEKQYPEHARAIDRGVLIGACAMLMLPLMHNAFLLTTHLIHGDGGTVSPHRVPETFTALFAAWAVLVVVTFLHPANAKAEMFSRVMGIIASVVFALKGDVITDYVIRLLGAGAGIYSLILMFVLAAGLLIALWVWRRFANEAEADATDTAVKTTT
ncbi:MAG: hypothetical protein KDJ36_12740 [Hyphomicrobiaceae bacterium]|nr:hypothetical protein [Hyphomicrobiaceae bacterium]